MLDLDGVNKALRKLFRANEDDLGVLTVVEKGRAENRYYYHFNGTMIFTFGITRSSAAKSKKFKYIPRQMGITNQEYKNLHDCPWNKDDYNRRRGLIE